LGGRGLAIEAKGVEQYHEQDEEQCVPIEVEGGKLRWRKCIIIIIIYIAVSIIRVLKPIAIRICKCLIVHHCFTRVDSYISYVVNQ
jgi:hypothetical protein